MRAYFLVLLAGPCTAHADTFTTTITGGGNTAIFPNVGGDSAYTYYPIASELYAVPLYVYINGGPRTQGSLIYYFGRPSTSPYLLLMLPTGPNGTNVTTSLYGDNIVGFVTASAFTSSPATTALSTPTAPPTATSSPTTPSPPYPNRLPSASWPLPSLPSFQYGTAARTRSCARVVVPDRICRWSCPCFASLLPFPEGREQLHRYKVAKLVILRVAKNPRLFAFALF